MTRKQRSGWAWRKWHKRISEHGESGQTISAYCRQRGLSRPSFFAWKRRLSEVASEKFVEVKVTPMPAPGVAAGAAIEVRLKNDIRLLVGPGFDAGHLRALLAVLESEA